MAAGRIAGFFLYGVIGVRARRHRRGPLRYSGEALESRIVLDSTVVFNEIMYHPADESGVEWIELHNQMAVDMDISGWRIDGGVSFDFPEGTVVPGQGYAVVASDPKVLIESTELTRVIGAVCRQAQQRRRRTSAAQQH